MQKEEIASAKFTAAREKYMTAKWAVRIAIFEGEPFSQIIQLQEERDRAFAEMDAAAKAYLEARK